MIINGLDEENLPVILAEEPETINFAIWGMLPELFEEDWQQLQNITHTLCIDSRHIKANLWYAGALLARRCLILVTGFFTTMLRNGTAYHYHICLKNEKPFYIAGTYTILEDGFITCSLFLGAANKFIEGYQNIVDSMPVALSPEHSKRWLEERMSITQIKAFLAMPIEQNFKAIPVAKELIDRTISYERILERYDHEDRFFG